jgi:predicted ArsR family transcriptional regulator
MLGILDQRLSSEELQSIFKAIAAEIAEPFQADLNEKSLDERIKLLKKAMTKEGYIVEIESDDEFFTITSLSCPYYRIGMDHPVICHMDQALIETFASSPVKIQSCICEGADRCTYLISKFPEKSYD